VGLHLVGVEDLLDALQLNQRTAISRHGRTPLFGPSAISRQQADHRWLTADSYRLIRTLSTLSHCDMSDRITESRTARPRMISMVLTEFRPTCTCTRVAVFPSSEILNIPMVLLGWP